VAGNGNAGPMVSVDEFDRFVFIVGAPRCGTTTLSRLLKDHPSIRFPAIKEPHFFAQHDLRGLPDGDLRRKVEREYLQRFFRRGSDSRVGADASVTYLYSPELLVLSFLWWADNGWFVMLRDSLLMIPSDPMVSD